MVSALRQSVISPFFTCTEKGMFVYLIYAFMDEAA